MFQKTVFADAKENYKDAKFVIFGVPFDATSSFRSGSRLAPDAMRIASYNFETYNSYYNIDLYDVPFCDIGNLEVSCIVSETLDLLYAEVLNIIEDGKIPIMLGGEHSLTFVCVKAFYSKRKEKKNGNIGVIVLDAHLDLRDQYAGTKNNHACVSRRILELTDRYVSLGIRSGSKREYDFARQKAIKYYTPESLENKGLKKILSDAIDYLNCNQIYLSIDMDVIDPAYAPAVGNPEPFGLNPKEVREIIRVLSPYLIGFDLVEITPNYDSGQTALLGAKLVREFMAGLVRSEQRIQK
ncbi:MAG: agmatinase [Methanosarcinales archaeon]